MSTQKNNTGMVIGIVSALALVIGGYFYLRKPKEEEVIQAETIPTVESGKITPPDSLPSTNPSGTTTSNPTPRVTNVYATANGAIVYKAESKINNGVLSIQDKIGAKVRNANKGDKVGEFKGYRDIQNYTYALVKDIHSGAPVFIAKSVSKTAL